MATFSIFEKMFSKIESLMCALNAHINRTHLKNWFHQNKLKRLKLFQQSSLFLAYKLIPAKMGIYP